ncbi:MAG: hypothetical protein SGI92_27285, partial [Bryobacteraceae bacterium]|nr:hypothetical protein [Bryobacteraceae bacterium]
GGNPERRSRRNSLVMDWFAAIHGMPFCRQRHPRGGKAGAPGETGATVRRTAGSVFWLAGCAVVATQVLLAGFACAHIRTPGSQQGF